MQKIKKFIYPLIFSASFILLYIILAIVLSVVLDNGSYAGAAFAVLFVAIWSFLIVPFYCIIYCKVIKEEKLKFLFAIYNSIVLSGIHQLPFNLDEDTYIFVGIFFLWAVFWSIIPLIFRSISLKKQSNTPPEEVYFETNPLLENKTKTIIAICFTSLYTTRLIFNTEFISFLLFQNFTYFFSLVTAVFTLIFLFCANKNPWWKKWLLPIAFSTNLFDKLISLVSSFASIRYYTSNLIFGIQPIYLFFGFVASVFMLLGVLFNYRHIKLLKYGVLGCVVSSLIGVVITIAFNPTLNFSIFFPTFVYMLFNVGIFILTTNKKKSNSR